MNSIIKETNKEDKFLFFGFEADRNQKFVANSSYIKEIFKIPKITKSPMKSNELIGFIFLREDIISLLDLSYILTRKPLEIEENSIVIVVEYHNKYYGFAVTYVEDIIEATKTKIYENNISGLQKSYITNFIKKDNELGLLVDFEKIMSELVL